MTTWSEVEFVASEDTACLDSVSREDNGSGLYQVDTLVKISTANEAQANLRLSSCSGSNWSIVIADKTVALFDQSFQTILLLLHFETDVDAFSVCRERQFLVVCERNGNIHFFYIPYKKRIFTKNLVDKPCRGDQKTFCSLIIDEDKASAGIYHMFVLINNGFFHIANLDLEKIEKAFEKMDVGALKELQSLINIDFCSTEDVSCSTAVLLNFGHEIHLMIGGVEDNVLTLWKMDPLQTKMYLADTIDDALIPGVKKMVVAENRLYILDTNDILSLWDLQFLVMIHCWPDLVIHDFELTTECGSASTVVQDKDSMRIITLTKLDQNQISSLQIRFLPSMTAYYSLDVSSVSCLVNTTINMDTIYLVEGIYKNNKSCGEPIKSVMVRCFTEALPENRLSRLLHKHMFEEAEKFAITFELDLELVYKVKLDFVLEQLASASVGGYEVDIWSELVDEAKTNLTKITDEQYVVDYCLKAPWPSFETAVKMLNHAASRYSCSQIHEAMARLDTFYSLHGSETFNGIAWIEFLNSTDNLGDVLTHLRDGDMKGAQLLWLRSEGQIAAEFDESQLEAVLGAIPQDLPSQELCPWFRTVFVPFLRRVLPEGQKILAKWLEQKTRYLELTERSAWPQNGLDLATLGLPPLWTWLKSDINGAEEMESLKSLVSNLCQLLDVQRKYKCKFSLSVFEERTVWSLAFFMLDKVPAPELIAATVENCISPYAEEHNLSLDELLLQYIKDLLARCSSQTTTLFTEWEAKAVAVHSCMTDTDLMVDAVLAIMQKAVVPWTKVVENLVQQYLEMDGPKQDLLNESYHLMEIRKLLSSYGIRNVNLSTSSQIMTLIRYILKQDLQTSLEDALTLAKGYKLPTSQIYYLYLIQLTGQGKVEEILTVLKKLSSAEAECVIERLTTWAWLQLEDKQHISEEHKKHQMIISQVMVEALKYLHIIQKYDTLKSMACENNLVMFKAIYHLQEDFDVFFTPSNYEDPTIRKQIQEHHITAYENTRGRRPSDGESIKSSIVANDPDGKTKTISTEAGLRRLGRQLQRTEQELWSDLALRALEAGKVDKALKILSELYEHHCNSNTGKILFNAAKVMCQMLEADMPMVLPEEMDLPAVIHNLACQAITVCDSDLLLDCLELCKCTRIAMDVYHQCQLSDNYGFVATDFNMTEKDSYSQWSFQDVFHEDCIVLDPAAVLPIQYEITNCLLPISHDAKLYPLDCSCLSHHSFVNGSNRLQPLVGPLTTMLRMLQECTQLELAMRVLVNSYGSCLQHVTSNVMNMKLSVKLYDSEELQQYNACLSELRKTTINFMSSVAIALLNKVFNWRVVDCDLAIGLCTLLPKAEVFKILWKVIDNTWQNYDKISAVAKVGSDLCCLFNEAQEQKKFHSVITDAEWGIKLGKLEISIQPVFRERPELKSSLIPDMVKNSKVTPDIVLQYCSTYGLDRDSVINQYITTLLLLQEDEEGSAGDLASCQEAGPPLCHADALDRVLQIIPMLNTTSELTDSLCSSIFKLSPYNYERIEVVLTIIHAADENVTVFPVRQAMALLQHLKSYERVSPPSDVETSYLFENGLLPNPLCKSRLPFHLLIQTKHYWKIISPELTEETFPTLLLITKLMKMSLDKLYMSAANHVFKKKMKPLLFEQRKKGQGHGYNKETFKAAKTMMQFIRCIQNPEFAAATAYSVTQELPPGLGRTQYLRFCMALGEAWLKDPNLDEASRPKAETYLSKLKLQFQRSATENALIANDLNSPEHQKLTGLPTRLIAVLYEHSSVEQRYKETGVQTYPDIHAAVKEIAAINNIDLLKICHIMLEKWICKTGPAVAKEIGNPDCVDNIEDDPDLMRVVYMLQSFPMDDAVQLLNPILSAEIWPLRSSGPRLTFRHQTRVLLCLVRLADATTLETRLQIPQSNIQYHLKCYIFVSQLEALNIPYTVRSFLSSPKEGLIKGLWKNHSHEPQAVRLVADLCLEYEVFDPQLLNSLLQRLLGFNLISHLQKVLEAIVTVPALWEMSSLCKAWRTITVGSLIKICLPLDSCELEKLYRSFVLLTKCPFLLSLDLRGIASDYEKVELYAFALGALCFISCVETREREIKAFLSANNPVTVLDQVEEHMETGQLAGIPSKIRDCALDFICRQGLHSTVLNTRHFTRLKDFVVSSGNAELVKELVDHLISENRPDDADEIDLKFKSLQRVKKQKY